MPGNAQTKGFLYRSVFPSTAVEHCLNAHFTAVNDCNIIVVKSTLLEVYCLVAGTAETEQISTPLHLLASFRLFGTLQSLSCARLPGKSTDSLFLAFTDAKASIVHWDQSLYQPITLALYSFEATKGEVS